MIASRPVSRVLLLVVLATASAAEAQDVARPNTSRAPEPTVPELASWAEEGEPGLTQAREEILRRIASLPAAEATIWLQLLTVLQDAEGPLAATAILAVGRGEEGDGVAGAEMLLAQLGGSRSSHRPQLLALAAQLAEAQDRGLASDIRGRLIEEDPDAPEAAEARLLRAEWLLAEGDRPADALQLLEELIVGSPQHPLAPEARRLYEAWEDGGVTGPGGDV